MIQAHRRSLSHTPTAAASIYRRHVHAASHFAALASAAATAAVHSAHLPQLPPTPCRDCLDLLWLHRLATPPTFVHLEQPQSSGAVQEHPQLHHHISTLYGQMGASASTMPGCRASPSNSRTVALQLDGDSSSNSCVQLQDMQRYWPHLTSSDFTFVTWLSIDGAPTDWSVSLFAVERPCDAPDCAITGCATRDCELVLCQGHLHVRVADLEITKDMQGQAVSLPLRRWCHVAVSWCVHESEGEQQLAVYLDGKCVMFAMRQQTWQHRAADTTTDAVVQLGGAEGGASSGDASCCARIMLCETSMWRRALQQADMGPLMRNEELPYDAHTVLILQWAPGAADVDGLFSTLQVGTALRAGDAAAQGITALSVGHVSLQELASPPGAVQVEHPAAASTRSSSASVDCPVCLTATKGIVFACGHAVCTGCAAQPSMVACPMCRACISARIRIFL